MDPADPVTGKKQAMAKARELQKRFSERFGHLRCQELLAEKYDPRDRGPGRLPPWASPATAP